MSIRKKQEDKTGKIEGEILEDSYTDEGFSEIDEER